MYTSKIQYDKCEHKVNTKVKSVFWKIKIAKKNHKVKLVCNDVFMVKSMHKNKQRERNCDS